MNINELTKKETELYLKVCSLNGTIEEKIEQVTKLGISNEYKIIHQKYAELSSENIEALKRGLFLNWFAVSEPTFLTGVAEFNEYAQEKIIKEINEGIKNQTIDFELNWMLNYYKNWEYALSTDRLPNSSSVKVYNPTDSIKKFGTTSHFTIYEGDWGQPYASRFEVWFKPDNGGKERKLFKKNYKIEGWMR